MPGRIASTWAIASRATRSLVVISTAGGLWVGKYLRTVTYQEVRNTETSGELGRVCGRAARVELFEGHARSGDVRAAQYLGDSYPWIDEAKALQA